MQGFCMQDKVSTRCSIDMAGDRNLAAKFIRLICFALADAFHFRNMPAVEFGLTVSLLTISDTGFTQCLRKIGAQLLTDD